MTAVSHGGHETVELIAAAVLVAGGAAFVARELLARRAVPVAARLAGSPSPPRVRRSLAVMVAGLSAGAALIHLVAAPNHYEELGDLGAGFLVAAALQGVWIRWCLAGPTRRTAVVGIVLNLGIVAAWLYTRTIGLPIGPFAGGLEPVGYPDALSVAFELLIVAGLGAGLLDLDRVTARRPIAREIASVAIVPVVGLALVLTSLATLAIATGLDHGSTSGHPAAGHMAVP